MQYSRSLTASGNGSELIIESADPWLASSLPRIRTVPYRANTSLLCLLSAPSLPPLLSPCPSYALLFLLSSPLAQAHLVLLQLPAYVTIPAGLFQVHPSPYHSARSAFRPFHSILTPGRPWCVYQLSDWATSAGNSEGLQTAVSRSLQLLV